MISRSRTVRTVVGNDLRRLSRDRLALFFLAVLPFVLIIAIGSFIPAEDVDVVLAVVDHDGGAIADELVSALEETDGFDVDASYGRRDAEREIRIGRLNAAVLIPAGFSADVESGTGSVEILVDPTSSSAMLVQTALSEAIDDKGAVLTVERELESAGSAAPLQAADDAVDGLEESEVDLEILGTESGGSNFAFVAGGQMILFMFVNSLVAGAGFIEMRRLGILGRALAGPVDGGDMLLGLGMSRFVIATSMAAVIAAMAVLVYGVDWGSLLVMAGVIGLFGLVAAGASMLIGAVFDEPDAAVSFGIPVGLAMAALGGCMFPLFLAPPAMQVAAKILTPHAWAVDAILGSAYDNDGIVDLWANFAVLAVWATVLLVAARILARRRLPGG